jgi:hypothetical protein
MAKKKFHIFVKDTIESKERKYAEKDDLDSADLECRTLVNSKQFVFVTAVHMETDRIVFMWEDDGKPWSIIDKK